MNTSMTTEQARARRRTFGGDGGPVHAMSQSSKFAVLTVTGTNANDQAEVVDGVEESSDRSSSRSSDGVDIYARTF